MGPFLSRMSCWEIGPMHGFTYTQADSAASIFSSNSSQPDSSALVSQSPCQPNLPNAVVSSPPNLLLPSVMAPPSVPVIQTFGHLPLPHPSPPVHQHILNILTTKYISQQCLSHHLPASVWFKPPSSLSCQRALPWSPLTYCLLQAVLYPEL